MIMFVNPAGPRKSAPKKKKGKSTMAAKGKKKGKSAKKPKSRKPAARRASSRKARKSPARKSPVRRRKPRTIGLKTIRKIAGKHGMRLQVRTVVKKRAAASKAKKIAKKAQVKANKLAAKAKKQAMREKKAVSHLRRAHSRVAKFRPKDNILMNPSRRRKSAHRRYRKNPSVAGMMALAKQALPVLAGMLVGKMIIKNVAPKIPGLDKLGKIQGAALSIGMLVAADYATGMVKALGKHRDGIMLGLGINVITELLSMIPQAKAYLGLGDEGIYDRALSDYVTTGEYLTTGAMPIDDDIALSDYITTGEIESELGLESELGIESAMGIEAAMGEIDAGTVHGGVSRSEFLQPVNNQSFLREIPARSFTKDVAHVSDGFDNPGALYAGIFRGGF
jgi:hypothetical protein